MKLLILAILAVSVSTAPNGSWSPTTYLKAALAAARVTIDETKQLLHDIISTSSQNTQGIQNILDQIVRNINLRLDSIGRDIDSNNLSLLNGQKSVNGILDILSATFNKIGFQLAFVIDPTLLETFSYSLQLQLGNAYDKILGILEPLLIQTPSMVDTWRDVSISRLQGLNSLEFVKAQTITWKNREGVSLMDISYIDDLQANFTALIDNIYADLFQKTLKPQTKQNYVNQYTNLYTKGRSTLQSRFLAAEKEIDFMWVDAIRNMFFGDFDGAYENFRKIQLNKD